MPYTIRLIENPESPVPIIEIDSQDGKAPLKLKIIDRVYQPFTTIPDPHLFGVPRYAEFATQPTMPPNGGRRFSSAGRNNWRQTLWNMGSWSPRPNYKPCKIPSHSDNSYLQKQKIGICYRRLHM